MKIHSICLISALSLVGASVQAKAPMGWDKQWSDCSKAYDSGEKTCIGTVKGKFMSAESKLAIKELQGCMDKNQEAFNKCLPLTSKDKTEAEMKILREAAAKIGIGLNKCEAAAQDCLDNARNDKKADDKKVGSMIETCLTTLDKCTDQFN